MTRILMGVIIWNRTPGATTTSVGNRRLNLLRSCSTKLFAAASDVLRFEPWHLPAKLNKGEDPMKRTIPVGFLIAASLLFWATPRLLDPIGGQAAAMEAPHIGEGGLPQFEKDPNFPKVPSKWRMGFGSAVADVELA